MPYNTAANKVQSSVITNHFLFRKHLSVYLLANVSSIVCESMLLKITQMAFLHCQTKVVIKHVL